MEGWDPPEADIWQHAQYLEQLHDISVSKYNIERAIIYTNSFVKSDQWDILSGLSITHIEHRFEVEINGQKFVGVFDAIGYDADTDTHYIIELKTTSSTKAFTQSKFWWDVKLMDNQPIIYLAAGKKLLGQNVNLSMMYFVIKTTKSMPKKPTGLRQRKNETDEDWLKRSEAATENWDQWRARLEKEYKNPDKFISDTITIPDDEVEDRLSEINDIITMVNGQTSFPRNPGNCDTFGGCEFLDVCLGNNSLDNDKNLIKLKDKSKEDELPF